MITPMYSGQGGGSFSWSILSQGSGVDYGPQLADIDGLTRATGFSGEIKVPELTITLGGGGLDSSDGLGSRLVIVLTESSAGTSINLGCYVIKNIEVLGAQTTIQARGVSGEMVPTDYNYYDAMARDPRYFALSWLKAACGGAISSFTSPSYTDSYKRSLSRVAAPASTLANLRGFTNATVNTRLRKGTAAGTSSWTTSWSTVSGTQPAFDVQWTPSPDWQGKANFLGNIPLFFHQYNQYWAITATARVSESSLSGDKCQFPLGLLQYFLIEIQLVNGAVENPYLWGQNASSQPNTTETITLTFDTIKEARQFMRDNGNTAAFGVGPTPVASSDAYLYRETGSKKVTISGAGTYTGTKLPYYYSAKNTIASDAPNISAGLNEYCELSGVVYRTSSNATTFAQQKGIMAAEIQFMPRSSAGIRSAWRLGQGITSNATLAPAYQYAHDADPITINQQYATRSHFVAASILGSMGYYEGLQSGQYGPVPIDLAPETGTVYAQALTESTACDVQMGTAHPLPGKVNITFKDAFDQDRTYYLSLSDGATDLSMDIGVMQGYVSAVQPLSSGRVGIGANNWLRTPGCPADRWSGSDMSSPPVTLLSLAGSDNAAKLICPDGTLLQRNGNWYGLTTLATYSVRDVYANQHRLFVSDAFIGMSDTMPTQGTYSDPYVDGFPLFSMVAAHRRVYADNIQRQAFIVKATMTFATVQPGDVLAVQLPKIYDGAPILAMATSVTVSPLDAVTLEIVPMHKITVADYSSFSNLGEVIPQ